jgi:hypothetical protein
MIRHSASCYRSDLRKHVFYHLHSSPLHCCEEVNFQFWRKLLVFCVVQMEFRAFTYPFAHLDMVTCRVVPVTKMTDSSLDDWIY